MRSYRIEEASAYFAQVTSRSSPTKTLVLRKTREIQQSRLGLRCSLLMDPGFRPGCSVVVGIVGLIAGADVIDMDAGYALCFVGEVPLRAQVARFQHRWCVVHPNALRPWRAGTDSVFIAPDLRVFSALRRTPSASINTATWCSDSCPRSPSMPVVSPWECLWSTLKGPCTPPIPRPAAIAASRRKPVKLNH